MTSKRGQHRDDSGSPPGNAHEKEDAAPQNRPQQEQELSGRDQVFRALVENTPDLIARFDHELRRIYVNPAIERLTGRPASELIGKTLTELNFHPQFSGKIEAALIEAFATGAETTLEVFLPAPDGTERTYQALVVPERGTSDEVDAVLVISRDITAIRRDQERVRALTSEIERANRLIGLGGIATAMSHEFNNVLMGIQPFAEILLRTSSEERVKDAANRILQSVKRGRSITEDLRAFTRPSTPVLTPTDVQAWINDSSAGLERMLPSTVRFDVDVAATPMTINIDRARIQQVLGIIILNARDAIGSDTGSIRLTVQVTTDPNRLQSDEPFVRMSVIDDGPGISAEVLPRVLDPFYTTKRNGKGLGLSIAQQIMTAHGGYLFVESEPGRGTTVHLFLPMRSKVETDPSPAPAKAKRRRWPSELLLVEDDEAVVTGLVALLEDEGVNVWVANDGAEALKILRNYRPQALVVDINLPDCNGFDLYEQITQLFAPFPAVFASAHADPSRIRTLSAPDRVRMLAKPYAIDTLLDLLATLMPDRAID